MSQGTPRPDYIEHIPAIGQYRTRAMIASAQRMRACGLSRFLSRAEKRLLADTDTQEAEAPAIRLSTPSHKGARASHLPDDGLPEQFHVGWDCGHRARH